MTEYTYLRGCATQESIDREVNILPSSWYQESRACHQSAVSHSRRNYRVIKDVYFAVALKCNHFWDKSLLSSLILLLNDDISIFSHWWKIKVLSENLCLKIDSS